MRLSSLFFALTLMILSGCSHYERYIPSSEKEKASSSYKTVRLLDGADRTKTVVSTVYLNEVYPDYTDGFAHFLVAFYTPEGNSTLYFKRDAVTKPQDFLLLLNGKDALRSEALESDDLLVELMPVQSSWNRYFYVRYALPSETPVLVLESDHTERAAITYQKAQE